MPPYSIYRDSPPYGTFVRAGGGTLVTWATREELVIVFDASAGVVTAPDLVTSAVLATLPETTGEYVAPSQEIAWALEAEMPGAISRVA